MRELWGIVLRAGFNVSKYNCINYDTLIIFLALLYGLENLISCKTNCYKIVMYCSITLFISFCPLGLWQWTHLPFCPALLALLPSGNSVCDPTFIFSYVMMVMPFHLMLHASNLFSFISISLCIAFCVGLPSKIYIKLKVVISP